jgi:hypothetical protein
VVWVSFPEMPHMERMVRFVNDQTHKQTSHDLAKLVTVGIDQKQERRIRARRER